MTARLRVGMNLCWLRPGIVGGSEVAAVSTVDALDRVAGSSIELFLYAQRSFLPAYPELAERMPTRVIGIPGDSRVVRVARESTWLPRRLRHDRIDVVHCYGGVVPPTVMRAVVLTLHDLQPLEVSSVFAPTKKAWLTRMIPASVDRADVVAVPSRFVRDRLIDVLGTDPDKIVVVPHGRDVLMRTDGEGRPDAAALRRRFRLGGPFVVYPAITYPHKNHATLVRAFARLARHDDTVTLVLTGGVGEAEDELARLVETEGVGDRVRRVGRVSTAERDVLLREAAVVAVPSRYEGFGLPVLEAFGVDTPVVASSAGSLPEVVGDAGALVDPDDVEGWTAALRGALAGDQTSTEGSHRRASQAARFDWDTVATQLVGLYRRAAAERGDR